MFFFFSLKKKKKNKKNFFFFCKLSVSQNAFMNDISTNQIFNQPLKFSKIIELTNSNINIRLNQPIKLSI